MRVQLSWVYTSVCNPLLDSFAAPYHALDTQLASVSFNYVNSVIFYCFIFLNFRLEELKLNPEKGTKKRVD